MNLSILEEKLGYSFKNRVRLQQALTHRSYINENRKWPGGHNERLEFLGDAVLELIITNHLFETFSNKDEGELTEIRSHLANKDFAAGVAVEIGLNDFLFLSRGAAAETKSRKQILANALEAIIGAIYRDGGYRSAEIFVKKFFLSRLSPDMLKDTAKDPKSRLQEMMQSQLKTTPRYETLSSTGPEHDKHFVVGVYAGNTLLNKGEGPSKMVAEKRAAEAVMKKGLY